MEKLKDIDTFYSQKVIPLAFNESLSYMEQICNLISYIENTLVPAINNNANAIKELQEYVQELKKLLDKLDEKINNVKEELTTLINNVNDTLTNAINNLDSKVVEHINASNEKFNALDTSIESINNNIGTINTNIETINTNIGTLNTEAGTINTEVGTIKEQIQTINTNVTQNTNDIENLKPIQTLGNVNAIIKRADTYRTQYSGSLDKLRKATIANNFFLISSRLDFSIIIKDEFLEELLNKKTYFTPQLDMDNTDFNNFIKNKSFNTALCGYIINNSTGQIKGLNMKHDKNENRFPYGTDYYYTPTTKVTSFSMYLNLYVYLED